MLIAALGIVVLLLMARLVCLERENVRLAADRDRLLREQLRTTSELRALAYEAATSSVVAEALERNLRPLGNAHRLPREQEVESP